MARNTNYKAQIDAESKDIFYNTMMAVAGNQIKRFEFAEDIYSVWDAKITTINNLELYIELKYRRVEYNKYPDTLLDKSKYDRLLDFTRKYGKANIGKNNLSGVCCLFVPMYRDRLYLFDLSKEKPIIDTRIAPVTTDFNDNRMIEKDVCLFDFKNGKEILYGNIQ